MMPLIHKKSPKAFSRNVSAEMHAGKPQKQALAIAYSVKNHAKHAHGGNVEDCPICMDEGGQTPPDDHSQVRNKTTSTTPSEQGQNAVNLITHPVDFIKSA